MRQHQAFLFVFAIFAAVSAAFAQDVAGTAGSPGNPSALELLRQAEAGKELTPSEREELAARAFMEMMKASEDRMEALDILIEGKITDDKGNPLSARRHSFSRRQAIRKAKDSTRPAAPNSVSGRKDTSASRSISARTAMRPGRSGIPQKFSRSRRRTTATV